MSNADEKGIKIFNWGMFGFWGRANALLKVKFQKLKKPLENLNFKIYKCQSFLIIFLSFSNVSLKNNFNYN